MNAEQRKAELKRIQETMQPCMTGITLTYHGERQTFNAYRITVEHTYIQPIQWAYRECSQIFRTSEPRT